MLGITAKLAPSFPGVTHASWPRISLSGDTTELVQPREDKWYWWNLSSCLPEDTLRPVVNTGPQPGLTYNMIWALQNQSPPSFLVLSCLTCWRMWGSHGQTKASPGWPIRWRELCPEHWSMHPAPGGGCFINEPIERVQAGGFLLTTVGSTLGGQPGECDVESEDRSLQGLRLVICSPTALGGGTFDRWIRVLVLANGWFTCLAPRSLFHPYGLP